MLTYLAATLHHEVRFILWAIMLINLIVHIIFANAIIHDAAKKKRMKQETVFVSGITWAFATLIGGVFVAGLYWLVHYSSLVRQAK